MVLLTLAMAAVAEMGEVDDIHSKEEDVTVNGDLSSDVDMENQESSQEVLKKSNTPEAIEEEEAPEEITETKETDEENSDDAKDSESNNSIAESNEVNNENNDSQDSDRSENDQRSEDSDREEEKDDKDEDDSVKIVDITDEVVHEIDDDDDDEEEEEVEEGDKNSESEDAKSIHENETIELNDSAGEEDGDGDDDDDDDGDVIVIESGTTPTENGTPKDKSVKEDEIVDLATPEKQTPSKKAEVITPRRSSRNLNKTKSYVEIDKEEPPPPPVHSSEESDIEEVLPQDPLEVGDSVIIERIDKHHKPSLNSSTIVVKDTKKLVEIASKSNHNVNKKEPTLVIIDTNSILSGRGPVPVTKSSMSNRNSYSTVLPMALPAQGMYPANMRATITPIPISAPQHKNLQISSLPTPVLPTLTDDMFVVEAPSFIVPYVYEKPPVKDFKEFVGELKAKLRGDASDDKDKDDDEDDEKMETDQDDEKKTNEEKGDDSQKANSYYTSPLGKFFIDIGFNLVQEFVQSDLLKQQKRKRDREGGQNPETDKTIHSLIKNLEFSKENNEPFKAPFKKCEFCSFKTDSAVVMSYHMETPHMKNFMYRCNFCTFEVRSPHDILYHMDDVHSVKGHLERSPSFHQCPNCPFEDNQKGKLSRHLVACMRKFKPDRNLEPDPDVEPPAKIPRVPKMRHQGLNATAAAYQAMSKTSQYQFLSKMQLQSTQHPMHRGRGRPSLANNGKPQQILRPSGMVFKQQSMSGGSVLVPTNYQLSGNQVFQNHGKKPVHQPSISITPLPRPPSATSSPSNPVMVSSKPGDSNSKNSFVICEICDGYIKDLEQLRNHMQWIHKIKIHPKMIYNRPPLNCQKCQFRFFTDQGLERHLLGSHGLVTSSMQDAANKSKDSGRCPVCGRVYQWKLLNHVARDHNMTLKPAHLSYKCTVCTATFGMYKQFENHVYSAHSVVAKRVMDKKSTSSSSANKNDQMKPLKINDEITIIPQPAKSTNGASKEGSPSLTGSTNSRNSTPSTSKNADSTTPSTSRAERLARRNATGDD